MQRGQKASPKKGKHHKNPIDKKRKSKAGSRTFSKGSFMNNPEVCYECGKPMDPGIDHDTASADGTRWWCPQHCPQCKAKAKTSSKKEQ